MNSKGWQQLARILVSSPAFSGQLTLSDVDRLWYAHVRAGRDAYILRDISRCHFKTLLVSLAESMEIHPWKVFQEVARYCYGVYSAMPSHSSSCLSAPVHSKPRPR